MECDTVHYLTAFTSSPLISFDNFPRQAMRRVLLRHTLILFWQRLTVFLPVGTGMEKTIMSPACLTLVSSEFLDSFSEMTIFPTVFYKYTALLHFLHVCER